MRKILYIFGMLSFMFACTGVPDFSNIPYISFNNIRVITKEEPGQLGTTKKDSVIISVNFQDGDGDLGITSAELAALKKIHGDSLKTYLVDIFVKKNGKFLKSNPPEKFGGDILFHLKEGNKSGPIEGILDYSVNFEYGLFQGIPYMTGKSDTVKFAVTLKDRALNVSNTIETTEVVIYK
jgi:hypothetical protein